MTPVMRVPTVEGMVLPRPARSSGGAFAHASITQPLSFVGGQGASKAADIDGEESSVCVCAVSSGSVGHLDILKGTWVKSQS